MSRILFSGRPAGVRSRQRTLVRRRSAPALLFLAAVIPALPLATGAEGPPAATVPEQVKAELLAANQARQELAREEQQWAAEKARLELLLSALRRQAERLRAETEKNVAEQGRLQAQIRTFSERTDRLAAVEAMLDGLAERLERDLDGFQAAALPGLVPPDAAARITEPGRRLDAALARLGEAERRMSTASVEIVNGLLGGEQTAVKLLRVGGVAAWWQSLAGDQAGVARLQGKDLILEPAATPEDAQAIARAFAIAEGRAAPDWVLLPAKHLQMGRSPE